jgi:hypothetical protein
MFYVSEVLRIQEVLCLGGIEWREIDAHRLRLSVLLVR